MRCSANQKQKAMKRAKNCRAHFLLRYRHGNSYIRVDYERTHDVRASNVIMQRSMLHLQYSPVHRWTGEQSTPEGSETMAARKKSAGRKKAAGRKTARKSTGRKTARKGAARKGAARKGAARKGAARKGAARKSTGRKTAKKGAAKKRKR
jgi:hypothetical protein